MKNYEEPLPPGYYIDPRELKRSLLRSAVTYYLGSYLSFLIAFEFQQSYTTMLIISLILYLLALESSVRYWMTRV